MASMRASLAVAGVAFGVVLATASDHRTFRFSYHPDEPGKVEQVVHRRKNFHHPLLLLTTAEVARGALLHGEAAEDPQRVVELGRGVSAFFAAAAAALLTLLAARTHGLWAGWAVALLVATNPLLYELAHYFKEDTALLFGVAACALAAHHHACRPGPGGLALLGAAAGIAAAGKYVGVALVPAAMWIGARFGEGARAAERAKRAGRVAGCALATWLVLDWRVFRYAPAMVASIGAESARAFAGKHGLVGEVPHGFYLAVQQAYGGPWVPALAALWLLFAIVRPRRVSVAEWLLAGVAVGFFVTFSFTPKVSARYYLPIAGALCVLAAAGAFHWAALAAEWRPRARNAGHALAFAACIAAAWPQWRDLRALEASFRRDDRAELLAAVAALPPTAVVAQDQTVGLPEPDRRAVDRGRAALAQRVLGAKQAPDLGSIAELRAQGVTYLALCERNFAPYFAEGQSVRDDELVASRRAFYRTALERGRVVRRWSAGPVTHLQPGLVLVDISALDGGA